MERAPIAEAPPSFARFCVQRYEIFRKLTAIALKKLQCLTISPRQSYGKQHKKALGKADASIALLSLNHNLFTILDVEALLLVTRTDSTTVNGVAVGCGFTLAGISDGCGLAASIFMQFFAVVDAIYRPVLGLGHL